MTELVSYVIRGIPVGCVFALMAIGIVLTYKTSGVFNLAFGAQAYVSAAVFYVLRDPEHLDWPAAPSFVVAVLLVGPALGWLLDRGLYRHLRTAPPLTKLVTSLGLLVAIPQIVQLDFLLGKGQKLRPPGIASEEIYRFGDYALDANQIATMVCTVVAVGALTVLFRFTALGLQMRAVVESPRMTELNGINADRVSGFSWMLSSMFAALAGVLIAPLFAAVSDLNFFTLLVAALAAAALGKLTSIPLALVGGLGLGVTQNLLAGYLPQNNVLSTGLRPSLPFLVLFALLLFLPGLRQQKEATDPLSGVDPPPPAPAARIRTRGLTIGTRVFGTVFVLGITTLLLVGVQDNLNPWLGYVIKGVILSVIFLSFTVITGLAGQISLCQASFAAVGAFATGQLVSRGGMSVLVAMVIAAAIAAAVGAVVALPALRLGGIYLALATLAFALMFEYVVKPLEWVSGGTKPPKVPRPLIAGIDFASNKSFLLLCMVLLTVVSVVVLLVRNGTTGRFLDALRGSEVAATSIGINPAKAKIVAFALSAAIAGFGGGLLASYEGRANYDANFTYYVGLVWLVLVISLGARSVQAAINAGISFTVFPRVLDVVLQQLPFVPDDKTQAIGQSLAYILFGFGAVTYAKHPEGIIEAQTRRSVERMMRRRSRGAGSDPASASGRAGDGTPPPATATAPVGAGGAS